ncbi:MULTISPECIES: contact-dependent growth inhibition system immunity protein [Tenebrionibacter/Tenebrionicola group]|jgi:hypothetical protein|uniref:Uncharacterized protein n=2 Tax=Tenebrionibacter/Tenebrionicola group TaxID=2969848 RepID=A0A8K0XXZ1_9ENTR|nr:MULTISPECIES: contact-dependent growth inhibition system immunity protein [Tenebrionibacter/Tenebrionicola group]MBK4717120.1 hypothetical protein [Tenebrionibacter intestinalis]MBV5097652.1 hypothetical protein [Tenebrionicola larvae]
MTTFRDLLLINNRNYELSNDSPLDQWFSGVVDIPIDQLDVGDIARSIRQDVFLADVLPRAEALLKDDPLAGDDYDGQLISSIASLNRDEIKEALPCFLRIASYLSQLNKNGFDRQMIMDIEKIIKLSQV